MKIKNYFFISLLIIVLISGSSLAKPKMDDYQNPGYCIGCHQEIGKQWKGAMHAQAEVDPIYKRIYNLAAKETKGETNAYCSSCHTPISTTTGNINRKQKDPQTELGKKGVSCDFCHTVSEVKETHNAQYVSKPGNTKRGPFKDANSPAHDTKYSELHTKSEFCGSCHDVTHPVNDLAIERTYTEWKEGPYNTGDPETTTYCQDCHMTPGPQVNKPNPGRAAIMGPKRDHIYTHYFVGGNTFITESYGYKNHSQKAKERLQSAAKLKILNIKNTSNMMEFKVKVKNVGAGHKLPTGLTESRQIWLEIKATDAAGKTIFLVGNLNNERDIDPETAIYHTVLGNSKGEKTVKVWKADRILSDHRIPPKGHALEKFAFELPENVKGPINIDAKLNYRSAPQYLVNFLWKGEDEIPKIPTIKMTETEKEVELK